MKVRIIFIERNDRRNFNDRGAPPVSGSF